MTYAKKKWVTDEIITSNALNNIENQLENIYMATGNY